MTTPTTQPDSDDRAVSGVDLARVALHAAREEAKKRGGESATPRARRGKTASRRGEGRDPQGFAQVLQRLMAERAWDLPAAGGTILDRWPDIAAAIAPQLPHHVTAVAFHAETGQLDLRPSSPAYATQLRLITPRIITAANEAVSTGTVRRVRVLPVGAAPAEQAPAAVDTPAELHRPTVSSEPSEGFRQALAAHQAAWSGQAVDPAVQEAVKQQTLALRRLSARAFPETEPHPIEASRAQRRRQAAATEAAALRLGSRSRRGATQASSARLLGLALTGGVVQRFWPADGDRCFPPLGPYPGIDVPGSASW